MVVHRIAIHDRGEEHALQPRFTCPADFLQIFLDVIERRDHCKADAAERIILAEIGHPAVVRAGARPLQFRIDPERAQADISAKGRRVTFGDAVREQHLGDDAVGIEHTVTDRRIPCPFQAVANAGAPLGVEIVEQEQFFMLLARLDLPRHALVEFGVVLAFQIFAVAFGRQPGMAVRRNNEIAIHNCLSQ